MDGSHSCGRGRPRAHGLTLLALAAAGLCALTPAAQAKHRPHPKPKPKPWVVRAKLPVPAPGQARFLHLSFRVKGNKAQKAAAAGAGPVIERPKQIPRWVLIDVALGKRKKADGPGVRYDAEVLIVNSKPTSNSARAAAAGGVPLEFTASGKFIDGPPIDVSSFTAWSGPISGIGGTPAQCPPPVGHIFDTSQFAGTRTFEWGYGALPPRLTAAPDSRRALFLVDDLLCNHAFDATQDRLNLQSWGDAAFGSNFGLVRTPGFPGAPDPLVLPSLGLNYLPGLTIDNANYDTLGLNPPIVKIYVGWNVLEPSRGNFQFSLYDAVINRFRAQGVTVLLDIFETPQWETGSTDPLTPPRNPQDFANFIRTVVQHYAGGSSQSQLMVEVWNEPGDPQFWSAPGGPNAAAYTPLLISTYDTVHPLFPGVTIVSGALVGGDVPFLQGMLDAGAEGHFDQLGFDSDTGCNHVSPDVGARDDSGRISRTSGTAYRELYALLLSIGVHLPLFDTEPGFSTTKADCPSKPGTPAGVSEPDQAIFLKEQLACEKGDGFVFAGTVFDVQDHAPPDTPPNRYGLTRTDRSKKPAFDMFAGLLAAGVPPPSGSCGLMPDESDPNVVIQAPGVYNNQLWIGTAATDDQEVARTEIFVNNKLVKTNLGAGNHGMDFTHAVGASSLPNGPVQIRVDATDAAHNVGHASLTVQHVAQGP